MGELKGQTATAKSHLTSTRYFFFFLSTDKTFQGHESRWMKRSANQQSSNMPNDSKYILTSSFSSMSKITLNMNQTQVNCYTVIQIQHKSHLPSLIKNMYTAEVSNLIWQTATAVTDSWFAGWTCTNCSKSYTKPYKLLCNLYSTQIA